MISGVTFGQLADWVGQKVSHGSEIPVLGISTDTRTIRKGEIFLALKGPNFDAVRFVPEAIRKGAAGVISEEPSDPSCPCIVVTSGLDALVSIGKQIRQQFKGKVIAITGSAGKSSTKEMLNSLLGPASFCSPASFNNLIGVSKTLCALPDGKETLVLEMGMNASAEIKTLCETFQPEFGIITNIGDAHMGELGGREAVYRAKKEMFDYFSASKAARGVAVNEGDPQVLKAWEEQSVQVPVEVLRYSTSDSAKCGVQLLKSQIDPDSACLSYSLRVKEETLSGSLNIFGAHQAENFTAAVAMAFLVGTPVSKMRERIGNIKPAPHRGEIVSLSDNRLLIDESYNSNPSALLASVESFSKVDLRRRKLLVLGDMLELGEFSKAKHEELGKAVATLLGSHEYELLGVGDAMKAFVAAAPKAPYAYADSLDAATQWLKAHGRSGDIIFLKGSRGIKLDRLIAAL